MRSKSDPELLERLPKGKRRALYRFLNVSSRKVDGQADALRSLHASIALKAVLRDRLM